MRHPDAILIIGDKGVTVTPDQERIIWESLLDADMSSRYWGRAARLYQNCERGAKIFLAAVSSSTVASWLVWQQIAWLWQSLSAGAAIIAVALSILNLGSIVEAMVRAAEKWALLRASYDRLWAALPQMSDTVALTKFDELKVREVELSSAEARLPHIQKLIQKSYDEVFSSRGLKKPG